MGILVATCCANLPENDIQHLTDEIREAEGDLKGMLSLENKEEDQMKQIATSIEGLPNVNADNTDPQTQTLVQNAAQLTAAKSRSASQEETQQQVNAQAALTEVSNAVRELQEKQELGEGAGET